jgi:SAM-dependent methyltransferase
MVHKSPKFYQFIDGICEKNCFQRKALQSYLEKQNELFWSRAEEFSEKLISLINIKNMNIEYIIDSYLKMCSDMIKEQIKFRRSGKYSCLNASEANKNIYALETEMASYVYGLALSQFLWPNHYAMYDFFISESRKITNVNSYLEIGPGHGLYLVESIKNFSDAIFYAIDISPVSIGISESISTHFAGTSKCRFKLKDVNHLSSGKYDYIVMSEVLEHLDEPRIVLGKINKLLDKDGAFFMTTCANCPAVDHVYQYHNVEHIRTEIREAGFKIVSELSLPVGDFPESLWAEQNIEVNYAAMLKSV